MKINEEVKKCIKEAVYIPYVTAGTNKANWGESYGCHLIQTKSDYIKFLDDETVAWPTGMRLIATSSNLNENGKIQFIAVQIKGRKIVNGYRIEGTGRFQKEGPILDEFKKKYSWATGCIIMKVERIGQSEELKNTLMKY
jgi:hypothetical protein